MKYVKYNEAPVLQTHHAPRKENHILITNNLKPEVLHFFQLTECNRFFDVQRMLNQYIKKMKYLLYCKNKVSNNNELSKLQAKSQ